jgi:DnaJ-class molecular chaperone
MMENDKNEPVDLTVNYVDQCRRCKGTGMDNRNDSEVCPVCHGKKRVKVRKDIKITITPIES